MEALRLTTSEAASEEKTPEARDKRIDAGRTRRIVYVFLLKEERKALVNKSKPLFLVYKVLSAPDTYPAN